MAKIKDVQTYIKEKNLNRPENIIKGVDPVAISLVKQMYSALKDRGDNLVLYEKAWLRQIEKIYKDQDTYDTFFLRGLESLLKQAYQILTNKSKSWDIIEEEILAIAEKIIFLKVREDVYKGFFDNMESTLFSALQLDFSNRIKFINIGNSQENIFTYKAVMINTLLETLENSVVSASSVNEVLNTLPGTVAIITNKQGSIRYINTLGENLFGSNVCIKKQITKALPGLEPIVAQFKKNGQVSNIPFDFVVSKNGSESISTTISISLCKTSPILEEVIYVIRINSPKRDDSEFDIRQKLHDKVAPVNTLIAGLQMLSNKFIDKDSKYVLDNLLKTAGRLKESTNDELKLIAFNSKEATETVQEVNLVKVICQVIEDIGLSTQNQVEFVREIQTIKFFSKQRLVYSILLNLISNAVKYSKKTKNNVVKIRFIRQKNKYVLQVIDTGIGIKKEKLSEIFEGKRLTKSIEGNGIGLTIVKEYVQQLNGTIEVESTFGIGSKFSIFLPVNQNDVEKEGI